jgi:hypothetical protein
MSIETSRREASRFPHRLPILLAIQAEVLVELSIFGAIVKILMFGYQLEELRIE